MPSCPRNVPDKNVTTQRYDLAAEYYDQAFLKNDATVRRFGVIDEVQQEITRGCHRVLELGCGTGRLLATIQASHRYGIDLSQGLLRNAVRRGLTVLRADAHQLPFADQTFDAITAGNAVFRYLDYETAFKECSRVLVRGGRLAVHQYAATTWTVRTVLLHETHQSDSLHVNSPTELRQPAHAAGFAEERCYFWRGLRFYPYIIRLPEWLSFRFWDHMTLVFRRI